MCNRQSVIRLSISLFFVVFLCSCKSELSGDVYLTYGSGDVKPAAGIAVRLIEGDIKEMVRSVHDAYDAGLESEARVEVLREKKNFIRARYPELASNYLSTDFIGDSLPSSIADHPYCD